MNDINGARYIIHVSRSGRFDFYLPNIFHFNYLHIRASDVDGSRHS